MAINGIGNSIPAYPDWRQPYADSAKTPLEKKVQELTRPWEAECRTCAERKYVDGSSDSAVSYQTPTKISPAAAKGAVLSHEMEHVFREQAKARANDREVVSQSVSLKYGICSECGETYVAGGTTRTTTKKKAQNEQADLKPDGIGSKLDMMI